MKNIESIPTPSGEHLWVVDKSRSSKNNEMSYAQDIDEKMPGTICECPDRTISRFGRKFNPLLCQTAPECHPEHQKGVPVIDHWRVTGERYVVEKSKSIKGAWVIFEMPTKEIRNLKAQFYNKDAAESYCHSLNGGVDGERLQKMAEEKYPTYIETNLETFDISIEMKVIIDNLREGFLEGAQSSFGYPEEVVRRMYELGRYSNATYPLRTERGQEFQQTFTEYLTTLKTLSLPFNPDGELIVKDGKVDFGK